MRHARVGVALTSLALAVALPAPAARPAEPTGPEGHRATASVALDLGALDEATFRELRGLDLERRAMVRLVQEGYAVVDKGAEPELVIRFTATGGQILLAEVHSGCSRVVARSELGSAELVTAVAQSAVALASDSLRLLRPLPATARPWQLQAGGGLLFRGGRPDARAELEFSRDRGRWTPLVALAWTPSTSQAVQVSEIEARAGLGQRVPLGAAASLQAGVEAGARVHVFRVTDGDVSSRRGARFAAVAATFAALEWAAGERFTLGLRIGAGVASAEIRHVVDGAPAWSRSRWELETGLRLGWRP